MQVGFRVSKETKEKIRKDAENSGCKSVSDYLRRAWRIAKKHPELLAEVEKEELDFQRSRPMSSWHPDVRKD